MTTRPAVSGVQTTAAAAIGGDREAIHALWQEHRRWIAAVLLVYKPRSVDLEDLLQEVAMTLVAKVNSVRDQANVKAWLRTVAINVARAAGRTERCRPVALVGDIDPALVCCNGVYAGRDEQASRILQLLHQLPETYREPLMLKAMHNMRSRHIAEILQIPEATVDTRISRARRMLRQLIEQGDHCGHSETEQEKLSRTSFVEESA